ncbi:MAG TPA: tRNA (adenosine(37)-N6)-threonylcarbamoyltransferase complex transferase subunit TsaD [Anaerolineae bacterium]|nr:tRNA (adenosine(37)-N6)-threonylcarbamoyltransferase complex transferase subunit TsaD [Caldilineae bacterium]HID34738.1 tRNA (adenosine(37)-N6)-threonylcarbamoyltransferase complex transferase subunit TsaD [Anaerolineae bacterium]
MTLILGIETSCDETAAAVVRDGRVMLSNVVASQIDLHRQYGGVFPEMASRQHVLAIIPVIRQALADASVSWDELDAVAVTRGPGLAGSLLVGVNAAKGAAWARGLPLLGINHLEGHVYSNWIEAEGNNPDKTFPVLVLIVSGGHTELILMHDHGQYERLGGTIDDAAGEAFDKVARVLGLGYPGGPAIQNAAQTGEPRAFRFPKARTQNLYDFSFSGLKTAVLRAVQRIEGQDLSSSRKLTPGENLPPQTVADLAASFQRTLVDALVEKTVAAAQERGVTEICVCGGVSANAVLRQTMRERAPVPVSVPPIHLCTDNAAMIAAAGHYRFLAGERAGLEMDVIPNLPLVL